MPYHWGRYRGLAQDMKRPPLTEHLLKNVFFDTCVYHQPGIELLTKVIPVDNILFASEMVGAVQGIDPETGHHFDDTKRYIDQVSALSAPRTRRKIFEGNARKVFGRLNAALKQRGLSDLTQTNGRGTAWRSYRVSTESSARSSRGGRPSPASRRREVESAIALATSKYDGVVFEMEHNAWDSRGAARLAAISAQPRADRATSGSVAPAVTPIVRIPPNGVEKAQWHAKQALRSRRLRHRLAAYLTRRGSL